MQNFKEELLQLNAEPCSCTSSEYCPDDNVYYPPIQCGRCCRKEQLEYYIAESNAADYYEYQYWLCEQMNKDQESEQQGH